MFLNFYTPAFQLQCFLLDFLDTVSHIQVIAEEDIKIDKEITIYYGEDYFYPGVEVFENSEEEEGIAAARLERHWKLYGRGWPVRSR
jgi:hypothetical protein